jgi:hypothetical protein
VLEKVNEHNLEHYRDESFPANEYSLISDWQDPEVADKVRPWSQYQWVRATEIESLRDPHAGKLQVFSN